MYLAISVIIFSFCEIARVQFSRLRRSDLGVFLTDFSFYATKILIWFRISFNCSNIVTIWPTVQLVFTKACQHSFYFWLTGFLFYNASIFISRPSLAQLNLMTNIAESMLETLIHTRTSRMFLNPSSLSTMVWMRDSLIPLTWTPASSRATSTQMLPSRAPGSVLAAALKDLVCLLESPRSRDWMLRI